MQKQIWETPKLTIIGNVETLTLRDGYVPFWMLDNPHRNCLSN